MHPFLDIKTNTLRRLASGEFVLVDTRYPDALCRGCADFATCPLASTVRRCALFVPVFVFRDDTHLDDTLFNTIRLGRAWSQRLAEGSEIGLYTKTTDVLRRAVVRRIYWDDDKAALLRLHASRNHLGMTLADPAAELERKLRSMYGNNFYNSAKGLTALYLSPKLTL